MENFKIKVTPEQSKTVQEILFRHGVSWAIRGKNVSHTDVKYLYCDENILLGRSFKYSFLKSPNPELTFEHFMRKYGKQHITRTKELQ